MKKHKLISLHFFKGFERPISYSTLRETQVLCLSSTRELAVQIQKVILALGDFMSVQCHACIGGINLGEYIRKLAYYYWYNTPGRVFDMIRRRVIKTLVLDKAQMKS